jgi:hypothetical protein
MICLFAPPMIGSSGLKRRLASLAPPHFEERSGKNEAHRLSAPTLARFSERLLVTGCERDWLFLET